MQRLLLAIAFVLGLATCAGTDFEKGMAAYERGDYATALKEWRPLAEQGNVDALRNLGFMYWTGQGVPQNYAEAAKWYRKAAEQGDVNAQNIIGGMYSFGQGVPKDNAVAVKWISRAAEQGHAEAQRNLGTMYIQGQGVPVDFVQAHKWLSLSASRSSGKEYDYAVKTRDQIEDVMTPAQINEAEKLALEWLEKHK